MFFFFKKKRKHLIQFPFPCVNSLRTFIIFFNYVNRIALCKCVLTTIIHKIKFLYAICPEFVFPSHIMLKQRASKSTYKGIHSVLCIMSKLNGVIFPFWLQKTQTNILENMIHCHWRHFTPAIINSSFQHFCSFSKGPILQALWGIALMKLISLMICQGQSCT